MVCFVGCSGLGLLVFGLCIVGLVAGWLGYLAGCGVASGYLFVTYMYFVYMHVYGYNNWSPYLGCGLLT